MGGAADDTRDRMRQLQTASIAFHETALRVNGVSANELARWNSPIYLAFDDGAALQRAAPDVEAAVRSLAAVARVSVERVAVDDRRRNFIIRASTRSASGATSCFSLVDWDEGGRIIRVEVHLNLSNFSRLRRCINHEVLHGFGLRAHPETAFSVLSYHYATQAEMTGSDRIVLETLYDVRLPAHLSMAATGRIACQLMAERFGIPARAASPVCGRGQ